MEDLKLGEKIQAIRVEKGLSLRKLAEGSGVTPAMLSQIENERVNPSLNTLRAIARMLDIPLYTFFREEPTKSPVVHPEERLVLGSKMEPEVRYELLTSDTKGDIEFCMMMIPPHMSSCRDMQSHDGEEVAYVLSGEQIELEMESSWFKLGAGDSVRIPAHIPHAWHNRSDRAGQVIFAVTPPSF